MRDGDGDSVGPWLYFNRYEAQYAATTYRNGIKRGHPGIVEPLTRPAEQTAPEGTISDKYKAEH